MTRIITFDQNRLTARTLLGHTEIRSWPGPEAYRQVRGRITGYHPGLNIAAFDIDTGPLIRSGLPPAALSAQKTRACAAWIAAIPEPVRTVMAPFPTGDARTHGQWDLLCLAARFGVPALDLMRSTPALAFLLSAGPEEQTAYLLAQSQVEQLRTLGFPGRKSLVKLLHKIPPQHLDLRLLRALRDHSRDEAVLRPLQHVATITASVLALVLDDALRPRIAVSFLEEIAPHPHAALWVRQAVARAETAPQIALPHTFATLSDLWACQDRLARAQGKWQQHQLAQTLAAGPPVFVAPTRRHRRSPRRTPRPQPVLHPPPLPGTPNIEPLTTPVAIRAWARAMKNCMTSYIKRVGPSFYLYKITAPEKAALAIAHQHNRWVIAELKGMCNQPVHPHTHDIVTHWLHAAQYRGQ